MWSLSTCISCMRLLKEMAYIQHISILSKDYPLKCVILLLSLQKFCTRAYIMGQSIKWSTHVQLPTKILKSSAIQQIFIVISFVFSTVLLESVVVSWSHVLCTSFDQPLKFFAQIHTGNNPTSFTLVWRCMSPGISPESVQRVTIQATVLLSTEVNIAIYCRSAKFLHPHSYTKSA